MADLPPSASRTDLRRVHYLRYEFHHEPEEIENSLLGFVYDVPYLGACGVFPPFHLLNWVLLKGGNDGGMGPGATWEPFSLSETEYSHLIAAVKETRVESLRAPARYAQVAYMFDAAFDGISDYVEWMYAACAKHRASYHEELRRAGFMRG